VTVNKAYLRDGTFLVLASGLASLLVMNLFGTNEVMHFSWLLLGPVVFLTMRHGFGVVVLCVTGVVVGRFLQGAVFGEIVGNAARYAAVLFSGAWVYRRSGGAALTFNSVTDYLRLYGVGLLMGGIAGGVKSIQLHFDLMPAGQDGLLHQVAGVVCGFVITMLPLLIVREWPHLIRTRRGVWEAGVIIVLSVLVGQVVFLDWWHDSLGQVARGYWMFLFVTLAALRLGPSGTIIIISITALQGLAGALHGLGFFSDDIVKTHLTNYYFYLLSVSSDGALVAVLFMKGQRDQQALAIRSAELEKFNTDLQVTNADLEQFAYVASHDLREPLRMVSSYLSLLERRYSEQLDNDAREFIGFARDGAKRLDRLVLDLLEFSRIHRHGEAIVAMPIMPAVQLALTNLGMAIEDCSATITVDDSIQSSWAMGDPAQIMRLFQNLIGNALKYRKPEVAPIIQIGSRRLEGQWEFSVTDNGIGIAPEYFERIFGIFQRLHTRDQFDGTGIGLAVCKKIVERHSGRIRLESKPDKGTTFFFTLPDGAVQS